MRYAPVVGSALVFLGSGCIKEWSIDHARDGECPPGHDCSAEWSCIEDQGPCPSCAEGAGSCTFAVADFTDDGAQAFDAIAAPGCARIVGAPAGSTVAAQDVVSNVIASAFVESATLSSDPVDCGTEETAGCVSRFHHDVLAFNGNMAAALLPFAEVVEDVGNDPQLVWWQILDGTTVVGSALSFTALFEDDVFGVVYFASGTDCAPPLDPVCVLGADQTCNDDPSISSLHGTCNADGTCTCNDGFATNPETGRCGQGEVACSCGPESCGTRICGRSECGYPCGSCASTEYCFLGKQCYSGDGPGTPCVDAWGDKVWEGDEGFRVCPSDSSKVQACTCGGGGPNACSGSDTCITTCDEPMPPNVITCGDSSCHAASELCCTYNAATQTCSTTGICSVGYYTRDCDGPEDCGGAVCCGGSSPWTATCIAGWTDCDSLSQFCQSADDCTAGKPYCCPAFDVRACSATPAADCN